MDRKRGIYWKMGVLAVSWMAMAWGARSLAQQEEAAPKEHIRSYPGRTSTPILDRIEAAGKNLFGLLPLPGLGNSRLPRPSPHRSSEWAEATPPPEGGSGSGLRNPAVNIYRSPPGGDASVHRDPQDVDQSSSIESPPKRSSSPVLRPPRSGSPQESLSSPESSSPESSPPSEGGSPWGLPLHERLRVFRESGFAGAGVGRSEPLPPEASRQAEERTDGTVGSPSASRSAGNASSPFRTGQSGAGGLTAGKREPTLAPPRTTGAAPETLANPTQTSSSPSGISSSSSGAAEGSRRSFGGGSEFSDRPGLGAQLSRPGTAGTESSPRVTRPSSSQNPARSGSESETLLMAPQSPILSIQTHGPRRITVGKEAPYEVVIQNSGSVAANDLVVTVELPPWAEVLSAEASVGSTQAPRATEKASQFLWRIGRLEPRAQEKLVLRIVPKESRPFELAVRWSFTPERSQAAIEVQEPKLALQLEGPREVVHGQRQIYKLIMTNTGNGAAENVMISLASKGAGEQVTASHKLGILGPGEKKVLEVELIPRSPGELTLEVQLRGDGNAQASLSEKITVRKPELRLTLSGPTEHFVGAPAIYRLQVSNPGNATAKNVQVSLQLPEGLDQILPTPEGRLSFDRRKLEWSFSEIAPEASQELTVRCQYRAAGLARILAKATADGDLSASDSISTQVEAVADLTLSVVDPAGPVPVGEEAVYEIRIHNRGTKTATQVEVVAYFSHGIEPVAAEGALHRIGPGQVVFSPIAAIAPGQTQVLKVKAKAERAGNHIFRAEVHCRSASVRLVSEGTTRYFGNAVDRRVQLAQPSPSEPKATNSEQVPIRTAERPSSPSSQEPRPAPARQN
ncbi:MAG: DUF11 domain-containing protein [Thermoguttaceae bacterium]|nr:DUF11 domain-containing protein [Thermoguttaceae bacterium]MDW8039470.1 hypothetical protein [Thermoguttaceae bacterium]